MFNIYQLALIAVAAFTIMLAFALWLLPQRTADLDDEDHE